MTLIEKISGDMTAAMRSKDQARLMPLRMAKAALMNREVEKGRALDEAESQQVVASLIKQRRDSVEQFTTGGRPELAARKRLRLRCSKPTCRRRWIPPRSNAPWTRRCARPGRRGQGHGPGDESGDAEAGRPRR